MSWQPPGAQPEGWQPEGWQPGEQESSTYPTVSASRSIRLPAGGVWVVDPDVVDWCEVIWTSVLPSGVTLASVAYTLPVALTLVDEEIDLVLGRSAVKVSGATHASMNQVAVVATLSNGMTVPFTAPLRCFNG